MESIWHITNTQIFVESMSVRSSHFNSYNNSVENYPLKDEKVDLENISHSPQVTQVLCGRSQV